MAGYRGHIVGAVICTGVYVAGAVWIASGHHAVAQQAQHILSGWQTIAGLLVIGILFGLWPDIDTNSVGQNIFFGLAFLADIILIATGRLEAAAYLGLLAMTPIVGHHRGWTHSFLAMALVPLPIVIVPYLNNHTILPLSLIVYGAAVAGYFSHLLLDGKVVKGFAIKSKSRY